MKKGELQEYKNFLIELTRIRTQWMNTISRYQFIMTKGFNRFGSKYVSDFMLKTIYNVEERMNQIYPESLEWTSYNRNEEAKEYKVTREMQWIPVVERLPKEDIFDPYLVSCGTQIHLALYVNGGFYINDPYSRPLEANKKGELVPCKYLRKVEPDAWMLPPTYESVIKK